MDSSLVLIFVVPCGLHNFHTHKVLWNSRLNEKIDRVDEESNSHDRYAVAAIIKTVCQLSKSGKLHVRNFPKITKLKRRYKIWIFQNCQIKEPCSPGRGLLLFSSTPRNETGDMPHENCQIVPNANKWKQELEQVVLSLKEVNFTAFFGDPLKWQI